MYECIHIMKKSIPFKEYKKKSRDFDNITEGKSIDSVEDLVLYLLYILSKSHSLVNKTIVLEKYLIQSSSLRC